MANLVLQNNTKSKSTDITLKVNGSSDWKISNNNGTFIINSTNDLLSIDTSGNVKIYQGHLFLDGATTNSASNTTQVVFRQKQSDGSMLEHIALSSNDDAFIINPASNSTTGQAVFYLGANTNRTSILPSSLQIDKNLTVAGTSTLTGTVYIKSGASATATLAGPTTAGTFTFPNTGGTFVTHETRGTAVGGSTRPVYIASTGRATAISSVAVAYGGTGATAPADARANLGAAKGAEKSATVGAAGWYRIAQSNSGISNCNGIFEITGAVSGAHTTATVTASTSYGKNANIQSLVVSHYSTASISSARIVYHTTYSGNYAYLEVCTSAANVPISTTLLGGKGWTLIDPVASDTIPSGYSNKTIALSNETISATNVTASNKFAVSATNKGYYLVDSANHAYPGVYDNGSNLWIGSVQSASTHHTGATYISTGYNGTQGNPSIYIAIPNANNNGASAKLAFHEGYLDVGKATTGTLSITRGGTGTTAQTANRLCFTTDSAGITSGYHYASSTRVGICMTSAPEAALGVKGEIHATSLIQTGGNSHRAYLYFRPTATSMSTGYIRMINGSSGASAISNSYFALIQNSYTASSNTVLDTTETYRLPSTAAGLTTSATYDILTTKSPVTIAQGGTGKTTRIDAANYLLNGLDTGTSTPVDADYYISQYVGGGTTTTTYHRRPMSALWAYVKGKMSVSNNGPTLAWGTTSTVGTVAGTALKVTMPANPNTDAKVQQARSAASSWRPVLMHYENTSFGTDPGSATNCVYYNESVAISPSGGHIQAAGHLITGTYVNAGTYIKAGSYGFISSYLSCGALIVGKNNDAAGHSYTGYGTSKPKGNVTAVLGRVYFQLV